MPFLWNGCQKPMTSKSVRPSPKRIINSFFDGFIKGASLRTVLGKGIGASMTVEAALVLPLFIFFFVNLGSSIEMIRLHGNLQLALWETGNRMCVYGHTGIMENESQIADVALSYTYVKSHVTDYVGREYLEESPLSYGASGLQFWESDVAGQGTNPVSNDVLDIVMTYQVSPLLDIPAVRPFRMVNRYYGRLWTGYDLTSSEGEKLVDVVYVAENAQVYHESKECTHLKLSIRKVMLSEARRARNINGARYTRCSKCGKESYLGAVYITDEGDFYHMQRDCPGLKRTIYTMPREEAVKKYRACMRCGET